MVARCGCIHDFRCVFLPSSFASLRCYGFVSWFWIVNSLIVGAEYREKSSARIVSAILLIVIYIETQNIFRVLNIGNGSKCFVQSNRTFDIDFHYNYYFHKKRVCMLLFERNVKQQIKYPHSFRTNYKFHTRLNVKYTPAMMYTTRYEQEKSHVTVFVDLGFTPDMLGSTNFFKKTRFLILFIASYVALLVFYFSFYVILLEKKNLCAAVCVFRVYYVDQFYVVV